MPKSSKKGGETEASCEARLSCGLGRRRGRRASTMWAEEEGQNFRASVSPCPSQELAASSSANAQVTSVVTSLSSASTSPAPAGRGGVRRCYSTGNEKLLLFQHSQPLVTTNLAVRGPAKSDS
ncbi:hypothetical protein CRG98_009859 [Punica granatum]|uniref:Uncharacterized protein n=1 Tax=Punica granatum TaxID=22663 RepID=A0A2I0KN30_PUNGR|nr:hypothetical protein CRG98_009859 [Punica granatum]